jgi:hypothetical protein
MLDVSTGQDGFGRPFLVLATGGIVGRQGGERKLILCYNVADSLQDLLDRPMQRVLVQQHYIQLYLLYIRLL